jgi:farnesyl-diphosphate farnesyltransferase
MADTLNDLLRATSRSFYLTLRVLPAVVRPQIGLAYLLARATDTVADTEVLPVARRLDALRQLRLRILGLSAAPLDFRALALEQGSPPERALLENVEAALAELAGLSTADRQLIRAVLETITSGQELDLQRFENSSTGARGSSPAASANARPAAAENSRHPNIIALPTAAELDDYTYRVAGCVGEFWTRICRAHVFPDAPLDDDRLITDGIRFGQGLQLVNILRDLPVDLRLGRCYLPADGLARLGLSPADLLDPASEPRLRPLYDEWLDHAGDHLAAGWVYTNALPWRCARVRLACAWPILIGRETIHRLRTANVLDVRQRVKVSRGTVKWLIFKSLATYPWPAVWRRQAGFSREPARGGKQVAQVDVLE